MYLEKYERLNSLQEQCDFLTNIIYYNPEKKERFINELKTYFFDFIMVTHVTKTDSFPYFMYTLLGIKELHKTIWNSFFEFIQYFDLDSENIHILLNYMKEEGLKIHFTKREQRRLFHQIVTSNYLASFEIIQQYFSSNAKQEYLVKLLYHLVKYPIQTEEKRIKPRTDKFYLDFLKLIILDMKRMACEEKLPITISYLASGRYKSVLKIGKYTLQVGNAPHIEAYPYCTEISAPILFKVFRKDQLQISVSIEMDSRNIKEEDIIHHYMKARLEGIRFLDAKKGNFGKYKEDYIHPYENSSSLGKQFLGIDSFDLSPVKKETIKLIDIDYYIHENDHSTSAQELLNDPYLTEESRKYEKEYQKIKKNI